VDVHDRPERLPVTRGHDEARHAAEHLVGDVHIGRRRRDDGGAFGVAHRRQHLRIRRLVRRSLSGGDDLLDHRIVLGARRHGVTITSRPFSGISSTAAKDASMTTTSVEGPKRVPISYSVR
jgi:hypothetical protein